MAASEFSAATDPRRAPTEPVQPKDALTVVWLLGEHDLSTAPELWQMMARAIELTETDIVVDMHDVEFMSAATVGVIVRVAELLRQESRSLTVRSPSRCALRVLDLCGLTRLVESESGNIRGSRPTRGAAF